MAPLRIAIYGQGDDVEMLRRSWAAVSQQPLEITHTELERDNAIVAASFFEQARRCDAIIYPLALMGEAMLSESVTDFSDDDLESIRETCGDLLVSLKNAIRFAGRDFAVPLGARLPAMMSTVDVESLDSWSQYDQWLQSEVKGKATEPLAPGWAGSMFLWRAASTIQDTWLFSRENFDPVIAEQPYVDVLQQMKVTASHSSLERMTPTAIWQALINGDLKAAIGFPSGPLIGEAMIEGLSLSDLPQEHDQSPVLLDLFTPVVSISTGCRQSAATKQFIAWLCGGDGSENLRRQVPTMTITRSPRMTNDANAATEQGNDYDSWLRTRLENPMTLPVIQVDSALAYYQALDEQVGRCLDGKAKPDMALREVTKRWQEITRTLGVENQMRQWRRCQGMRA